MAAASRPYRLGVLLALGSALFLVWGVGALGIIGDGGPPDLLYVGALLVGIGGVVVARLRAEPMSLAMTVTAAGMLLAGLVAVAAGLHDEPGASVPEILGLSVMFAALFGTAGWLFRRAARAGVA